MNGWWKFHRKMVEGPWWNLPPSQLIVWITILNHANHRDKEWWNGTERVIIPRGSFITSQDHLARFARVTRKQVRGALIALISLGSISAKSRAKRYTEICVINWDTYQGTDVEEGQVEGQARAKQGPSEGQVRAITGEGKEGKKKNLPVAPGLPLGEKPNGKEHHIRDLLTVYDVAYQSLHHQRPVITGQDAKAAKAILANRSPEVAAKMVQSFLSSPPDFYREKGLLGMRHILSAANTLLARREVSG